MKIDDTLGSWILVFPINNLCLTNATKCEIHIDRVTLIQQRKFKRKCKSFGLVKYSELTKDKTILQFFEDFHDTTTLAIIRESGKLGDVEKKAKKIISLELDVLAMSRLYSGSVRPLLGRTVASGQNDRIRYLAVDSLSEFRIIGTRRTPTRELVLDERWHEWQKMFFLNSLIKCLKKEHAFEEAWRETILRAVSLISEGMTSNTPSFAFLHNMIALETLLLRQGDEHKIELPSRLRAFLGWCVDWEQFEYEKKIKDIYSKRCKYVHDGNISTITESDVEFTDHLLHNIFNIILKHPTHFNGKDAIVDFANKISAERLLGIPPHRSKYLPRTIRLTCLSI